MARAREIVTDAFNQSMIADADQEVLKDERAFYSRFGFDANREQRRQILKFKHNADVTDAEIRILRRRGSIRYHPHGVEILAPSVFAAWGYVQIIALGLLMVLPILRFGFKPDFSWPIFIGILPFEAVLVWLVKLTDDVYIRPHRIRKRVLRQNRAASNSEIQMIEK